MDLSKATTVKKASVQKQNFDLRFSYSNEKFQLSDSLYANKQMNSNGLTLHTLEHDGENVVFVTIQPHEDSIFYKGKDGDHVKDTGFSYSLLVSTLEDAGLIGDQEKGFENFALEPIGEKDGAPAYRITPYQESDSSVDAEDMPETVNKEPGTDLTGEPTEDSQDGEEREPVVVEEEDDFDPFE